MSRAPVTHTGRVSASPVETIKQRQREWAARSGHTLTDKGYCGCDDDNIHRGLSESARREFAAANGSELGGKILATHSSSALACNWFDYWRERDFASCPKRSACRAPLCRCDSKRSCRLACAA